jgi:hypothetical protein
MTTAQKIAGWFLNVETTSIISEDGYHATMQMAKIEIDGISIEADEFNLFFNNNQIVADDNYTTLVNDTESIDFNELGLLCAIQKGLE